MRLSELAVGLDFQRRRARLFDTTPWYLAVPSLMLGIALSTALGIRRPETASFGETCAQFWPLFMSIALLFVLVCSIRRVRHGAALWLIAWLLLFFALGQYIACERTRENPALGEPFYAVVQALGGGTPQSGSTAVEVRILSWKQGDRVSKDGRKARLYIDEEESLIPGATYVTRLRRRAMLGAEVEGAFDPLAFAKSQGIGMFVTKVGSIAAVTQRVHWHQRLRWRIATYRKNAQACLASHSEHGIALALALGLGGSVSPESRDTFARLGLAHVLAVSGFHFSVVAGAVLWILSKLLGRFPFVLRRFSRQRASALVALPVLWAYLIFVGAPMPAQRAFTMTACASLGAVLARKGERLRTLSVAALGILLWRPHALYSISFSLSFLAVLGLFYGTQNYAFFLRYKIQNAFESRRWLAKPLLYVMHAMLICAGTTLATAPLLIHVFGQIPVTGMLTNLWVMPYISFVMLPMAMLTAFVANIHWRTAQWVGEWSQKAESLLVDAVAHADHWLPLSHWRFYATWYVVAAFTLLAVVTLWPGISARWRRLSFWTALAFVVVSTLLSLWLPTKARDTLRITFVSVGQADATLIELPNGRTVLIDAGAPMGDKAPDMGKTRLVPYLRRLRIDTIDALVITHPHYDHYAAIEGVLESIKVREIWTNGADVEEPTYVSALRAAASRGVPIRDWTRHDPRVDFGDAHLTRLWPPHAGLDAEAYDTNEQSIVVWLGYGEFNALFMGDAGKKAEEALLGDALLAGAAPLGRGGVDVLKAGHHGSDTASGEEFLEVLSPRHTVISVGAFNRYRLPSYKTTDRLWDTGTRMWRTDWHGSVRVVTDGQSMHLQTMRF